MLVQYLLPPGLRGIVVAGLLSALMGSLAGVFNACSTLFTVDIYQKWKPQATEHQLVRVGRTATTIMVVIALIWIPVIKGAQGLYTYLQAVQGYLAPPIFVVFFVGVFFKRLNAKGAFWSMLVGFARRNFSNDGGHTGHARPSRLRERLSRRLVLLDRQQNVFPVLQRADRHHFGDRHVRRQLRHRRARTTPSCSM